MHLNQRNKRSWGEGWKRVGLGLEGGGDGRKWVWDWKVVGLEESGFGIGRGQNWKSWLEERGKPGLKPLVLTALLGQLPHFNTFASAFMT